MSTDSLITCSSRNSSYNCHPKRKKMFVCFFFGGDKTWSPTWDHDSDKVKGTGLDT